MARRLQKALNDNCEVEAARLQLNALKDHICNRLDQIKSLVQSEKFNKIYKFIKFSSGGNNGDENFYINFGYKKDSPIDIDSALYQCKQFKKIINKRRKVNTCHSGHI
jgi:hypothetical protein